MRVNVVDTERGYVVWTEDHPDKGTALKAVRELADKHYNARYFTFYVDGEEVRV
ncbi:hypothetical protein D3C71_1205830 [compost metagenome]